MIAKRSFQEPEWLDLKAAQSYACVSERTLREWIHRERNPLPAAQVERGKLLIKRSAFDQWLESQPFTRDASLDLNRLVDEVMKDMTRVN